MSARPWLLMLLGACAQTDLVARYRQPGAGNDGGVLDPSCGDIRCSACTSSPCSALETQAALCDATGPSVTTGDSCRDARPSFQYALCSCSDLTSGSTVTVDAFDGTLIKPAPDRGALGINGNLSLTQPASIAGAVRVAGQSTTQTPLAIERVEEAPCACASGDELDVRSLVTARRGDNDNASAGIAESALDNPREAPLLELTCGRYFFTRIAGTRPITIRTRGDVALFVEGNIELDEALSIQSQDGARVSLFVAGELRVGGSFALGGDPNGAGRASLYSAGQGTLALRGSASIIGNLVAPNAELVNEGILELYGSMIVRRAAPLGALVIHYDTSAATPVQCSQ